MQTFAEAIKARGLKEPATKSVKWHNAMQSKKENRCLWFPEIKDVTHRALIEAQAPGALFVSPPQEYGEEVQFSSRDLTDWYVREFIHRNHLKH